MDDEADKPPAEAPTNPPAKETRESRLAAALRANLRRRKVAGRGETKT